MPKKIINITLSIILFLLPIIILPPSSFPTSYNIPKIILLYCCGIVLFFCLLIERKNLKFDKFDKLLFLFISIIFISTIFSINLKTSILGSTNRYEGLLTFICYYLVYYCSRYFLEKKEKTLKLALITISFTSILAILQYYNVPFIHEIFTTQHTGNSFASSTFGNRNFFASFLCISLPFTMCYYIFYNKKIYLLVSCISFYALIATLTRSAWLAFFVFSMFGIIYLIKHKNLKMFKNAGILLILFILLFSIFYFPKKAPVETRYTATVEDIKNINDPAKNQRIGSGRKPIWDSAFKIIESNPIIGSGPDTFYVELKKNHTAYLFEEIVPLINALPDKAHNEFLQIAATLGIPALIVYLIFLFITIKHLFFIKTQSSLILLLCIISYLVQAFFNISTIGVAPIFYFLLGYSYQLSIEKKDILC